MSPKLDLSGIPESSNAIIPELSDRSYVPMDNGGHGMFGYEIEPSVAVLEMGSY